MLDDNHNVLIMYCYIVYVCCADKNPYRHDGRADKNPYRHDRCADSQCPRQVAAPGATGSHETKSSVIQWFLAQPRDVSRPIRSSY